ncbi:MAG: hypothetical protein ABXS92_08785 [Sulfurimonas sp.]
MIDEQLQYKIIKIIKEGKEDIYEKMDSRSSVIISASYTQKFEKMQILLAEIERVLNTEMNVFNDTYDSEEEMLAMISLGMDRVTKPILEIAEIYAGVKAGNDGDEISVAAERLVKKILSEYLLFMDKLEGLIAGTGEGSLTFEPDIEQEVQTYLKIAERSSEPKRKSLFFPLLAAFGLGWLFGGG